MTLDDPDKTCRRIADKTSPANFVLMIKVHLRTWGWGETDDYHGDIVLKLNYFGFVGSELHCAGVCI